MISKKAMSVTFISLNDNVLLHIFKFLNWIDSVNLAATCKRMKTLKYWVSKQNEVFDLKKYVEKNTVPIGDVLPVIGPFIRVAKIADQVDSKSFMERCCNLKSLKIDGNINRSAVVTLNTWMKASKIESLFIGREFEDYVEPLLDGIEELKSFSFDSFMKLLPGDFFKKNSAIEHLLLILPDYHELALDLSTLVMLHSLRSIFLTIESTDVLNDVRNYLKIDELKEFSIFISWKMIGMQTFGTISQSI